MELPAEDGRAVIRQRDRHVPEHHVRANDVHLRPQHLACATAESRDRKQFKPGRQDSVVAATCKRRQ